MKKYNKLLRMMCCMVLLLCAMTVTAFADSVDDELSSYAGTLAKEYGLTKGSRINSGSGSGNYQLGSSSASAGRGLYVIELQTIVGYERVAGSGDNCHMDCALFYQGTDNKVYWTKYFNFNDHAEDFLDNQSALADNQTDALSIQLPANCKKILAFTSTRQVVLSRESMHGRPNGCVLLKSPERSAVTSVLITAIDTVATAVSMWLVSPI